MVAYLRPKNLRQWLVRASLPGPPRHRSLRQQQTGFKPCRKRGNCALCAHSVEPVSSYTCPVSGTVVNIGQNITCSDIGIYILLCKKDSGQCQLVHPTYVGECGDGESSSFTHRLAGHLGTATNRSQADTVKPVGCHFRLPGHNPDRDMLLIPIEKIADPFISRILFRYSIYS